MVLQDKGYKTKVKSLEEILKSSKKMEAKLIGYDEIPTDIDVSRANQAVDLNSDKVRNIPIEGHSRHLNSSVKSSSSIRRLSQPTPQRSPSSSDVSDSNSQAPSG